MRQVAGVACSILASVSSSRRMSRYASDACSLVQSATRAPTLSGSHSSRPAMSNEIVVTATSVSPAATPGVRCIDPMKLASARCETPTPFGVPVEPDV
jgi:hypothetical protein